jgi:hypothetical protein
MDDSQVGDERHADRNKWDCEKELRFEKADDARARMHR